MSKRLKTAILCTIGGAVGGLIAAALIGVFGDHGHAHYLELAAGGGFGGAIGGYFNKSRGNV